jgi:protein SCO1
MRFRMRAACILFTVIALLASRGVAGGGPALPNVVLRTHENKAVRFYDDLIKGRVVLLSFMFTSCQGICPRTTANLLKVQKALGDHVGRDVFVYSLSLDPTTDTPAVLNKYANSVGAKPGWTFLTGKPEDLELLRRRLGFSDPDLKVDADRTQHGALIVYGNDAAGRWSAMPALASPDRIAAAVLRVMGPGTP